MDIFRKVFEEYKEQKQSGKSDYLFRALTYYYECCMTEGEADLIKLLEYLRNRCDWLIDNIKKENVTKYVPTIEDLHNLISSNYIPKYATDVWNDICQCVEDDKLSSNVNNLLIEWHYSKKHESFFDIELLNEFCVGIRKELERRKDFESYKNEATKWKIPKIKENIRDFLPENLNERDVLAKQLDESLKKATNIGDATRKIMDYNIDLTYINRKGLWKFLQSNYKLEGSYSAMTDNVRNYRKR